MACPYWKVLAGFEWYLFKRVLASLVDNPALPEKPLHEALPLLSVLIDYAWLFVLGLFVMVLFNTVLDLGASLWLLVRCHRFCSQKRWADASIALGTSVALLIRGMALWLRLTEGDRFAYLPTYMGLVLNSVFLVCGLTLDDWQREFDAAKATNDARICYFLPIYVLVTSVADVAGSAAGIW